MPDVKTDNNARAKSAKIELRVTALEWVGASSASVLDCFCGMGEMHRGVWWKAARYVGIDQRVWTPADPVKRFVADNETVLRGIDLSHFNVFDLDAYGSPWRQAMIIAARRPWAPGEKGAAVFTDGLERKLRYGSFDKAGAAIFGSKKRPATGADAGEIHKHLISEWASRSGVSIKRLVSATATNKGQVMRYSAAVFEGSTSK